MYYTKNDKGEFVETTDKLYTETEYTAVKNKNNELRTTNTNLLKANESLSAFAEVLDGVQNITPDGLMKKIEEKAKVHADRIVTDMRTAHETKVKDLETQLSGATGHLNTHLLGDAVRKAGPKHGVQETAYDDVIRRAEADFHVKDGKVVFKHDKRDSQGNAFTVETWLADVVKNAPHLVKSSSGPAARQNSGSRTQSLNTGDRKSGLDLIASGLAQKSSSKSLS